MLENWYVQEGTLILGTQTEKEGADHATLHGRKREGGNYHMPTDPKFEIVDEPVEEPAEVVIAPEDVPEQPPFVPGFKPDEK